MQTGLVPDGMFPGDPGLPLACITIWPPNAVAGARAWFIEGRLSVTRLPSGKFTAALAVAERAAGASLNVSGNPSASLPYAPAMCKSLRRGLSANSVFHCLGVSSAPRAAGCWPTR